MSPDLSRYDRQMLLPGVGEAGQRKLLASTAVILGCGGLGSVAAEMLARAGVGHLKIVDRDVVDITNLQRQVLFDEQDVADGLPKAEAARRQIARINSQVRVTALVSDLNHRNIERLAQDADILVDGLDNVEARYLANDYAVQHGVPYVYGGAVGTAGLAFAILPHTPGGASWWETASEGNRATPCLRCLFEEAPPAGELPTCDTVGVVGPLVSIVANVQAAEALKILTGNLGSLSPSLLSIDLASNHFTQLPVGRAWSDGDCPCCKHHRFDYLEGRIASSATTLCGGNTVHLRQAPSSGGIDLREVARRLERQGAVSVNDFMVRARITDNGVDFDVTLFADGRAMIKGTGVESLARGLYAKYIGH